MCMCLGSIYIVTVVMLLYLFEFLGARKVGQLYRVMHTAVTAINFSMHGFDAFHIIWYCCHAEKLFVNSLLSFRTLNVS